MYALHTISNPGLQTNKSVNNFSFEQSHFPHQTNAHHILRCTAKVHGETTAQPSLNYRQKSHK